MSVNYVPVGTQQARVIACKNNNRLIHALRLTFFLLLIAAADLWAHPGRSQTISPLEIVISPANQEAQVTISGTREQTTQIDLAWVELIPLLDGGYRESALSEQSASPCMVVSPASFRLAPGERREVNLRLRDPACLSGTTERRSHLLVTQRVAPSPVRKVATGLPIDMVTSASIPVFLRPAVPSGSVRIEDFSLVRMTDGGLAAQALLASEGAATQSLDLEVTAPVQPGGQARPVARLNDLRVFADLGQRRVTLPLGFASLPEGQLEVALRREGRVVARRVFRVEPAQ